MLEEDIGGIEDFDIDDFIADAIGFPAIARELAGDGIDHTLASSDFTEDGMAVIEVGGGDVGDEKLGAIRAGAAICHREDARF